MKLEKKVKSLKTRNLIVQNDLMVGPELTKEIEVGADGGNQQTGPPKRGTTEEHRVPRKGAGQETQPTGENEGTRGHLQQRRIRGIPEGQVGVAPK